MNGTDPPRRTSPSRKAFLGHKVKAFVYNQQVTDSLTESFLTRRARTTSRSSGVYETMPTPATTTSRGCWPR